MTRLGLWIESGHAVAFLMTGLNRSILLLSRCASLRRALHGVVLAGLSSVYLSFRTFSPLTYGQPELSAEQLASLRWRDSWDILFRRR